ncbi:T9SS type A sorting domain-containing protein [Rhodohalobacter mucosus]|uniref:Secretion system C-terminal sorting domain-containing protein n=1 Tax=Rhodohalobacter mucosus TaxID=2079485 RepID=A0A316TMG5_9BACT|nr:T9SS type A sorting domain-containing protein [Rhodohalobacter mucosus]PWN05600.1 hypothetical protein DDZ15_13455 [Rhodohalobacter mucosus]
MRDLFYSLLLPFCLIAAALFPAAATAQSQSGIHLHPHDPNRVFAEIELAEKYGTITAEEALLEKYRYVFNPDAMTLPTVTESRSPVKCLLPLELDYHRLKTRNRLSPSSVDEIERYTNYPQTNHQQSYLSDSGNFIFYYETDGVHAVPSDDLNTNGIPDYVEQAAFAADSSYRYQVEQAGFVDFLKTDPYEIYFENFNFYGVTNSSGSTSFIRIHNNFDGFPPNAHPEGDRIGSLYVTIAHEIKHAIQYETNRWDGDAGSFDWIEMDATMMEEVVFDNVNDYYNYIKFDFDSDQPSSQSIFGNTRTATPGAYWHVSWMLYFYEALGIDFWVSLWEQFIPDRTKPFLDAVADELDSRGLSLGLEHIKNHTWHMTAGPDNSAVNFGFEERFDYPNSTFYSEELNFLPDIVEGFTLNPYAAQYIRAIPASFADGQPSFRLESTRPGVGLGVMGYFRDGSVLRELALNPVSTEQSVQTAWNWNELDRIAIAVVNTNPDEVANYTLEMTSTAPEEDLIAQNYPNPFNNSTRITFALTESRTVKLDIYDSLGRRVQTLLDEQLNAGYHTVPFNASGLASGVYFYRITSDNFASSKKMILVK